MNTKKLFAGACVALSLCLLIAVLFGISSVQPQKAYGNVTAGMPVLGVTQLVVTGTNALNLASGAATAGTSSVPCNNLTLQIAGTNNTLLMGASAGTAACTFPLYLNATTGTAAGTVSYSIPATNLNQIWFYTSSGAATVNANYAQ